MFTVPEVASWFRARQRVDAYSWGARRIWDDVEKGYRSVSPGELLYPVFEGMPMGWTWALQPT
eukprot:3956535-Heterocapsa_arctica.AAC.1